VLVNPVEPELSEIAGSHLEPQPEAELHELLTAITYIYQMNLVKLPW